MDFIKKFKIVAVISWRNVWKNKRRTILTLLTILIGSGMIIIMRSFQVGSYEKMIEDAISENVGHIQIHEKGFWDNQTIDYAVKADSSIMTVIEKNNKIKAYTKRIHSGGLLSYQDTTSPALIQAIDPQTEVNLSSFHKNLTKGRYLKHDDTVEVVIGDVLAKNLGATLGSKIALISQGFDGSIAAEYLKIVGIFNNPNPEYNRMLLLMNIQQAEEIFSMMGFITSIAIQVSETSEMEKVRNNLIDVINDENLEIMGWDLLMPEIVQFITMDKVTGVIFIFILFLVVAFGIMNTIQMAVFERIRELGVMLAIGTRPLQVRAMVLFESFIIAIFGVALGVILGSVVSYLFQIYPIDMSAAAEEMKVWGINSTIFPSKLTVGVILFTSLITIFLAIVFTYFPARKASKLDPIRAIRHF